MRHMCIAGGAMENRVRFEEYIGVKVTKFRDDCMLEVKKDEDDPWISDSGGWGCQ